MALPATETQPTKDHLAGHIVQIVGDRLDVVHVPVVDRRISVYVP
jgi:hypothetical protein